MPLTALTMFIASLAMFTSWFFITQRLKAKSGGVTFQAGLMAKYFLFMSIFCFLMFAPHFLLNRNPSAFPLAMALGYVIGHIFCYIAFMYIIRLIFSIVPRLNNKYPAALVAAGFGAAGLTVFNAITMIWGVRPEFSVEKGVTLFNAHPAVGAGIAVYASLACVPFAILMIINGFTNSSARIRSFLLGGGFLISMIAGPLHDVAQTASIYMLADIITIFGVLVTTAGVLYRIEQKISVARTVPARAH